MGYAVGNGLQGVTTETGMDGKLEMWIRDRQGREILFAYVVTVESARSLWTETAGLLLGMNLEGFEVREAAETPIYEGNYVTDEC